MNELFSVREAAAIAEVSPVTIRTALEKKAIVVSNRQKVGKAVRYGFLLEDILLMKLLTEFPFPLSRDDKAALKELLVYGTPAYEHWRTEGPDLVFSSGDLMVFIECKGIRSRLEQNVAIFRWGKKRIVSRPDILNGTRVFRGTRISLEHVAGLFRKGISEQEISEDFPSLSARDLAYAKLHSRLGRLPGRPRKSLQIRKAHKAA